MYNYVDGLSPDPAIFNFFGVISERIFMSIESKESSAFALDPIARSCRPLNHDESTLKDCSSVSGESLYTYSVTDGNPVGTVISIHLFWALSQTASGELTCYKRTISFIRNLDAWSPDESLHYYAIKMGLANVKCRWSVQIGLSGLSPR